MSRISGCTQPLVGMVCLLVCLTLVGCSRSEDTTPTRAVQFGAGALEMRIDADWELADSSTGRRTYVHREHEGLALRMESLVEEFGLPLQVRAVKAMIGKELNLEYGGVWDRVTLTGLAMLRYSVETLDDYDDPVHNERWVLAKPTGQGDITRIEFELAIPEALSKRPGVLALVERLDVQVGDARIPRV